MYKSYNEKKPGLYDADQVNDPTSMSGLIHEYSPTIPYDFPKEKLPKNLCQTDLLSLNKCVEKFREASLCNSEYSYFLQCKNRRDVEIFDSIKNWESELFKNKNIKERSEYLNQIILKSKKIDAEFEKVPSSFIYRPKKFKLKFDSEQLKWRINYLKSIN